MLRKPLRIALYVTVWLAFAVHVWAAMAFFLLFA
jgi:hypothetical protein